MAEKWDIIKKTVFPEKLCCQENSVLKRFHHGCLEFSEQLDIIDSIGKYFLMEKMAFC